MAPLGEYFFENSSPILSGVWGRNSPTSGKKTEEINYERIVNRHNLKMRFWQKLYNNALLAKLVMHIKEKTEPRWFTLGFGSYICFRSDSAKRGNVCNREKLFQFPYRILRNDSFVFCGRAREQ